MSEARNARLSKVIAYVACLATLFTTVTLWGQAEATQSETLPAVPRTFLAKQNWNLRSIGGDQATPVSLIGTPQLVVLSKGFECVKCNAQIGLLNKRFSEFAERGLTVHVFVCDEEQALHEAVGESMAPLNFTADPKQSVFKAFLCDGKNPLHGVFLIDKSGNIRWSQTGTHALLDLDQVVEKATEIAVPVSIKNALSPTKEQPK